MAYDFETGRRLMLEHGLVTIALVRFMPVAPFMVVNLAAGALRVRLSDWGGAQALAAGFGEAEDGKAFRDVLLGPGGEPRRALGVCFDEVR